MRDTSANWTTDWTHWVLVTVSQHVVAGSPSEVARLTRELEQASWWEVYPSATDLLAAEVTPGYRCVPLIRCNRFKVFPLVDCLAAGSSTPSHNYVGLWGIELLLDGVIKAEFFSLTLEPQLERVSRGATILGLDDHAAFPDSDYAHRCRNLSLQHFALAGRQRLPCVTICRGQATRKGRGVKSPPSQQQDGDL